MMPYSDKEVARKYRHMYYLRNKEKNLLQMKIYAENNVIRVNQIKKNWILRNPDKRTAHIRLGTAIRNGTIVRKQVCDMCGKEKKTECHHPDYSKPLEVIHLCKDCHIKERINA